MTYTYPRTVADFVPVEFEAGDVGDYLRALDAEATAIAGVILAEAPPVRELWDRARAYRRQGLEWLAGTNEELAAAIELDARLEAAKMMAASAAHGENARRIVLLHTYSFQLHRQASARRLAARGY